MSRCPSELALEAHLLSPEGSSLAEHLGACASCRGRLATMEAEGDEFRRAVFPQTVDAIAAAHERRPLLPLRLPALAGALAALGVAVLLVPKGPRDDYLGTKGALGFSVFVGAPGRAARAVGDGEAVPAAAQLRFRVQAPESCRHLWVISVDPTGQVSRLFPAAGEGGGAFPTGGALPGGAVLDGVAGPERVFAVCAPAPVPFDALESAARASIPGGERGVRQQRTLDGLPQGVTQATVLLEKVP